MKEILEIEEIQVPMDLNRNGLDNRGDGSKSFDQDLINRIRQVIRNNFIPTKRVRIQSGSHSYSLKHRVEKHINQYCSNGDLILAMIYEGYHFKRDAINCFFNVDPNSTKLSDNRPRNY
jgi:hypothetical protein